MSRSEPLLRPGDEGVVCCPKCDSDAMIISGLSSDDYVHAGAGVGFVCTICNADARLSVSRDRKTGWWMLGWESV
jgi:hypothetical protein